MGCKVFGHEMPKAPLKKILDFWEKNVVEKCNKKQKIGYIGYRFSINLGFLGGAKGAAIFFRPLKHEIFGDFLRSEGKL